MTTAPDLPVLAATRPNPAARVPRVRVSQKGFFIEHPDPATGEQLIARALGVADREAMDGLLRQLVRASVTGRRPDEVNLAFMLAMVASIGPRDPLEAMLVAQMVSVHVMAMQCAQELALAADPVRQDAAARALGRLARTFPAQMEALNRHRSGAGAITVQNVSVGDGGHAIVGNVTQHAQVIVTDRDGTPAIRDPEVPRRPRRRRRRAATASDAVA